MTKELTINADPSGGAGVGALAGDEGDHGGAGDGAPAYRVREVPPRPPEQKQPGGGDQVHKHVEQTVGEDLRFDAAEGLARHQAQQMVPLQHLMQKHAVEKAAEAEPEQIASPRQPVALG